MLSIRIAASFHNSYFLFRFISDSVKQAPIGQKKRQPCQQAACSLHDKILRLSMHVLRMHKILLYHCTGIQVTCQYQSRRNVDAEWSQCGRMKNEQGNTLPTNLVISAIPTCFSKMICLFRLFQQIRMRTVFEKRKCAYVKLCMLPFYFFQT